MDRAIRNCLFAVGAGALIGGVIGNNTGSGSAGRGAAAGAIVGAGACAVFVAVANEQDRARMRELELAAIRSNSSQSQQFVSANRQQVTQTVRVTDAAVPDYSQGDSAPAYTACRYSEQTISVQNHANSASVEPQLWCRLDTGDWEPVVQ
jgi:hypothetical protein